MEKSLNNSANAVYVANTIKGSDTGALNVVLLDDKKRAYFFVSDLDNFFPEENLFFFPATSEKSEYKKATAQLQRTSTLAVIAQKRTVKESGKAPEKPFTITPNLMERTCVNSTIVVTYTEAYEEKALKASRMREHILKLKVGDTLSHDTISAILFDNGFHKSDFVVEPGDFALRGSIVDIFSFADSLPYRIDFFGDQIESIRRFNTDTQVSTETVESVAIYPNLDENFAEGDYVAFSRMLPEDAVIWDFRDTIIGERNCSSTAPQPVFNKNFELLASDIETRRQNGYEVTILSPNDAQSARLKQILRDIGSSARPSFERISLHEGYIDHIGKNCYYTDHQIFDRYHKVKVRRQVERSERLTLNELSAFQVGDYVVHIDHGVGRYGGLVKTNIGGRTQEAVKLIYKDNDVIFVSIHGIHRISRYKSRDGEPPRIYKLGSKAWENLKNTTKSKVKDIAKDLIKLYSERQQSRGFSFSPDNYLQHELESSFMYEDTPDQQKATVAVKADMESIHPMDRLVCGDVGFGKTEVAIRAAFKAVCDSKQVAVLVPTTILALQHWRTFSERLKEFPCTVDYLSRLRSAKEIKEIKEKLKEGKIDIIIGTHRLLGKQIEYKDLGLLIIDEEQKFGVSAKEKLRQLKSSVDTLTLTATPIPRTLQFSLLGARDLSIINTPPPNRLPVYTEVINFEDDHIADIITRELERGGQVYFVHNKVEDILSVRDILHRIVPEAEICVAHGRMEAETLEKKVLDFVDGEYDILLATTIIENGIDIPNANTIIINQAQKFGLSDLHQLRGRVGRSNVKAFCYLVVPPLTSLSDDARRRIKAIEAFSELGSGFNIAMQDLDIRGAGNLLGAEQSGFMAEMGFETYMRILNEAMAELPQEYQVLPKSFVTTVETQVDTDLEVLIPDDYVNVPAEKIRLYKELDGMQSEQGLQQFEKELEDRFGPIPEPTRELIAIVRLRRAAQSIGIERIVLKNGLMLAYFISNQMSSFYQSETFSALLANLQKYDRRYNLTEQNNKLYIKVANVRSIARAQKLIEDLLPERHNV